MEDINHCVYDHTGNCDTEDIRNSSISGLDPYLPRFSLGSNSGLECSFIDSNVIDGVEYAYTVTAYDMGLPKIELSLTESDSSGIFSADTIWDTSNPGRFTGPDSIIFFNDSKEVIERIKSYEDTRFLNQKKVTVVLITLSQ